ncbi:MAG: AI-2E family transporter, partial [Rikenellaceae bacterium]
MENITTERITKFGIGIAIAAISIFLVWFFSSVVIYILISAILAVMFRPMVQLLTTIHIKGRTISRGLAAAISLITIWIIFLLIFGV